MHRIYVRDNEISIKLLNTHRSQSSVYMMFKGEMVLSYHMILPGICGSKKVKNHWSRSINKQLWMFFCFVLFCSHVYLCHFSLFPCLLCMCVCLCGLRFLFCLYVCLLVSFQLVSLPSVCVCLCGLPACASMYFFFFFFLFSIMIVYRLMSYEF